MIFYKMLEKSRLRLTSFVISSHNHLFICSTSMVTAEHDNERQEKIKILERLKLHIAKRLPEAYNIPVRRLH
jgi:hypothetical protein